MAVCCQNLSLGVLSSRSASSLLVGALFKKDLSFMSRGVFYFCRWIFKFYCSFQNHFKFSNNLASVDIYTTQHYVRCKKVWKCNYNGTTPLFFVGNKRVLIYCSDSGKCVKRTAQRHRKCVPGNISKWKKRRERCIASWGDYFEGDSS
jgi:hypothetical protein